MLTTRKNPRFAVLCSQGPLVEGNFFLEQITNKKVFLRERKRHTDRRLSSTPSVNRSGVPPLGEPPRPGLMGVYPRWGTTPSGYSPSPGLTGGCVPEVGYPPVGVPTSGYLTAPSPSFNNSFLFNNNDSSHWNLDSSTEHFGLYLNINFLRL